MINIYKNHEQAFVVDKEDKSVIVKMPLLSGSIITIKNITDNDSNKFFDNNIIDSERVSMNNSLKVNESALLSSAPADPDRGRRSVLTLGTKIMSLLLGVMGAAALGYYLRHGSGEVLGNSWQAMSSAGVRRETQKIIPLLYNNSLSQTKATLVDNISVLQAFLIAITAVRLVTQAFNHRSFTHQRANGTAMLRDTAPYPASRYPADAITKTGYGRKKLIFWRSAAQSGAANKNDRHPRGAKRKIRNLNQALMPACAQDMNARQYWLTLIENQRSFKKYNEYLHERLGGQQSFHLQNKVAMNNTADGGNLSMVENKYDRGRWAHTFGVSDELALDRENLTQDFIDMMLSDILHRKYGLSLSSRQLAVNVTLDIVYKKTIPEENKSFKYIAHGTYTIRQVFLRKPVKMFSLSNRSESDNIIISKINIQDADKDNFLSYLEFILNGESASMMAEFERLIKYFDASQDIQDAYVSMAKNRLAAALLPIMADDRDTDIKNIVEQWMDGLINEQLVGINTPDNDFFMASGVVAIAKLTGGLLISLATSEIYLWTPDDDSTALKNFITSHLSVQHKAWLTPIALTATMEIDTCSLKPAIVLVNSTDLWADLKSLAIEKLDEHIDHFSLDQPRPEQNDSGDIMQQRLLAASNAVALLAFFITGGSSAGCAALMLSNMLAGASGLVSVHSALNAKDAKKRKEAWESALLTILITGLAGADDMYSVIKTLRSQDYTSLYRAANQLRSKLNTVPSSWATEAFFKSDARERTVMLAQELVKIDLEWGDLFNKQGVKAMLTFLTICGRIENQPRGISAARYFSRKFSQQKILYEKEALAFIPAGNEIAIVDNDNKAVTLLLLSLGSGKFAGYNLKQLGQTLHSSPRWEIVESDSFNINIEGILLRNGRSGTVYIEDSFALPSPAVAAVTEREGKMATKFRRYCNRYKFDGNIDDIYSGVERFALNNGFHDVRYRVLFIFNPAMEEQLARHYLIVARHQGDSYIFEHNAENLRLLKLPQIEDVMILAEDTWRQHFEKSAPGVLITYKDFTTLQMAQSYDHSYSIIENDEKILLSPPGFAELSSLAAPVSYSMFQSKYYREEQQLLQKIIRSSIIKDRSSLSSYEFIISIVKKTGVIDENCGKSLLNSYHANPQDALLNALRNPEQIRTFADMLRVEPGKLVRFTSLRDSTVSHVMLSVGNGRFAGMDNSLIDAELSKEKRILIAEQLGVFKDDILYPYSQIKGLMVEKGDLQYTYRSAKSLSEIAAEHCNGNISGKSSTRFALEILVAAKRLVPQQADALERMVTLMLGKLDGDNISLVKLNKFLVINKYIDNNLDLNNLVAGKLVVFYTEDKKFHTLVSLGEDRFIGINNYHINRAINESQNLITSQDIGEIIGGRRINNGNSFKVLVGDANVEKTRISALLGADGRIDYIRHGLNNLQMEVKAHGALASVNHYDAIELADIINGIHRSLYPDQILSHIELISCFGALGGRRSSAQILSDRLGATVESYRGIITDTKSCKRGSGTLFEPNLAYGIERIRENERWHRRIHNFIEEALILFGHLPFQRHSRAISDNIPFPMVVIDVLHFLRKEIGAQQLMRHYPGLMAEDSLHQASLLANPARDEEALIAAMLIIFNGNSTMRNALDAYLISREYDGQPGGASVINGRNLLHPLYWQDIEPPLSAFRQLPSIIVSRNLLAESNIYISFQSDKKHIKEYLIRVGSDSSSKTQWPLLLANFLRDQSEYFPIMAGVKDQDILTMGLDFTHFHFYLNSWFSSDFSLQIDMTTDEPRADINLPVNYVHFSGASRRRTDTRDDIGIGHSLLAEQGEALALHINETLAVERSSWPGDGNQTHSSDSHQPSMPRAIVTLLENRERLVMLQRNIPRNILSRHEEVAFFIAGEINKYTETIKVGVKQGQSIAPVRSSGANMVYSDPATLNKSWILINLIHND